MEKQKYMTLREFMDKYEDGCFADKSCKTMCEAGWCDWFCRDSALKGKLDRLYPKVKAAAQSKKINIDTMYVLFQNNCPGEGKLYDEFKICGIRSGKVIYAAVPRSGHTCDKGRAELWGRENEFKGPIVTGTWKDIKAYLGIQGGKQCRKILGRAVMFFQKKPRRENKPGKDR
jgi:hypothetical protein